MWKLALRWLISQTMDQCFVCLIDKYQGIKEHSTFLIKATLMRTGMLEMWMQLIG